MAGAFLSRSVALHFDVMHVTRTIVVYGDARDAAFSATPAPTPAADWQVDGAAERLHADAPRCARCSRWRSATW